VLSTAAVGIDITDQQVRVVCLKKSLKGVRLAAAEECLLAEDKQLKDKVEDISGFLNKFMTDHRISAADIYIGIPTEKVIFREIELPLAVKENLPSTLAYEMEKYVPLSAADVHYDFQVIAEDREGDVLSVALQVTKRSNLEAYLRVAEALDIPVSGISPVSAGVVTSFFSSMKSNVSLQVIAFSAEDRLELAVARGRQLVYAKNLPPAGEDGKYEEDNLNRQVKALMQRFGEQGAPVLFLHTQESPSAESRHWETVGGEAFEGKVVPTADLPADDYIPAYGLALQAFEAAGGNSNLMPADMRKKPNKTPFYVMYGLFGCLLLTGFLWAGIFLARQYAWMDHLNQKLVELRSEASQIEEIRADIDQLRSRIHRLESLRPGNAYVINVLMELTRRIPETAWVKDLNISGNEAKLYGIAASASELIPALEASPLFHDVEFLSTIRKTRDNQDVFRIGLKFNRRN